MVNALVKGSDSNLQSFFGKIACIQSTVYCYCERRTCDCFSCPCDNSQGALYLHVSIRPSVRLTLQYRVCVISSSTVFNGPFFLQFFDILNFDGDKIIFDGITGF